MAKYEVAENLCDLTFLIEAKNDEEFWEKLRFWTDEIPKILKEKGIELSYDPDSWNAWNPEGKEYPWEEK